MTVGHYLFNEYYTHLERFPHHQKLPEGLLDELTGMLAHGCIGAS